MRWSCRSRYEASQITRASNSIGTSSGDAQRQERPACYANRSNTFLTPAAVHSVPPLAVGRPSAIRAAAICRKLVAPDRFSSLTPSRTS
jgi:hypothetical protein